MKTNTILLTLAAAALAAAPATAQTIGVTAGTGLSGGLYTYDYTFTVTGPAGTLVDNLFLGSDDLAPVTGPTFLLNGAATTAWTYADYATGTSSGLQFTTDDLTSGLPVSPLGNGGRLEVLFSSPLAPTATHRAVGLDYNTGSTNVVAGLAAPTAAVPEAGPLALLAFGLLPLAGLATRRRR